MFVFTKKMLVLATIMTAAAMMFVASDVDAAADVTTTTPNKDWKERLVEANEHMIQGMKNANKVRA